MATAHLLVGFLGSGKTTLGKKLEQQHFAVRFTPDDWMARLFGEDPPAEIFQEKARAVLDLFEPTWTRLLNLGVDVVLDYGFWARADRDHVRSIVQRCGANAVLYRVDCQEDEARIRVAQRNLEMNRSLYIAPQTFDVLKARFEPLEADELCQTVVAKVSIR